MNKKVSFLKILLYIIYIFSIGFFLFKKDYGRVGLSVISLSILFILTKIYMNKLPFLDDRLFIVGNLFILFSFVLGSSYNLYDKIKFYDDFLHFWSGFISVKIGWNILKETDSKLSIGRLWFCIVLFLFAMGVASICEISEYLLDTYANMKTQAGGLKDTMQDMIDAFFGASIMIIYYYRKYLSKDATLK